MRYLKKKISDGVYDFIPLEAAMFAFTEVDENSYRVEVFVGKACLTLFEKRYISNVTNYMQDIAKFPDGVIVDIGELL